MAFPAPSRIPISGLRKPVPRKRSTGSPRKNERTLAAFEADPRYQQLKAEGAGDLRQRRPHPLRQLPPRWAVQFFWQDKANPKGLLRRTTLESYRTDSPQWEVILDVDALAAAEGKGVGLHGLVLPAACADQVHDRAVRRGARMPRSCAKFDTTTKQFVEGGFVLGPEKPGRRQLGRCGYAAGRP